MGQGAPGTAGFVGIAVNSSELELIIVACAAFLLVVLVVLQLATSRERRLRKRATSGYHQRDLARYTPGGLRQAAGNESDPRTRSLAPSFAAPTAGARNLADGPMPTSPVPTASASRGRAPRGSTGQGTIDPATGFVPSFDPAEAERIRPVTSGRNGADGPDADPSEELHTAVDDGEIPPPAGALPLLHPPTPRPSADSTPPPPPPSG